MNWQLAQVNIARRLYDLDDPKMKGFVDGLDPVNALAEQSDGFVWRLQTEEGDATGIVIYDDPTIIVNMSVWETLETLMNFVRSEGHVSITTEAFVVYLNGRRLWASGLGDHPDPLPHNATATEGHRASELHRIELPLDFLETESNVVAIQSVLMDAPLYFLVEIAPSVHARLAPDRARKRAQQRLAALRNVTRSPGAEERIAYFEARLLETLASRRRKIPY